MDDASVKIATLADAMHQQIKRKDAEIEGLRTTLKKHHDWHLNQGEVYYPDGKDGYVSWDGAEAYSEGDLCEETMEAMRAGSITSVSDGGKNG